MDEPTEKIAERVARDIERLTAFGQRGGYFRAQLRLIPTEEGGRRGRIYSGYRSTWWLGDRTADGSAHYHDAPLTVEDGDRLELGEVAVVRLYPTHPEYWADIRPGQSTEMREGSRVVGEVTIIERIGPVDERSNGTVAQ
jgi:hypothetical protein